MMAAALALARRSLGRTWPNPAVGCVIERDGRVLAIGRTQEGGRPHAEADAIARAQESLRGATVWVTLEPCSHHGRTPPCAEALIEAGISRVVSSLEDPDPRVSGQGHARLREAGVKVEVGAGAAEARDINRGFFLRVADGRPLFTLKLATSLDGRIATASGESRWITGASARARGHRLRATHDAILVGIGTALADDPQLDCRLPGLAARSPIRIVVDTHARLPLTSQLVRSSREVPVWLVCRAGAASAGLARAGVEIVEVATGVDGRVDPAAMAQALGARGLTRVLVEGGGAIAAAWLKAGLVDDLVVHRGGLVLGADSRPAISDLGLQKLDFASRFTPIARESAADDLLETWTRRA